MRRLGGGLLGPPRGDAFPSSSLRNQMTEAEGFACVERRVPVPDGGHRTRGRLLLSAVEAELAEYGTVAFGREAGAEAGLSLCAGDGVVAPLRVHADGEQVGERGIGEVAGHVVAAGDGDEGAPFDAHGGGDVLLVALGERVSGPMSPRTMRSKACHSSRVSGRICASTRGFCGEALTGWPTPMSVDLAPASRRMVCVRSAWIARELGGEVAVFPARDVVDEKGVELVLLHGNAEFGVVVLRVHFAGHLGDTSYGGSR